MTHEMSVTK